MVTHVVAQQQSARQSGAETSGARAPISAVERPLVAASSAHPAPVAPPPITSTSMPPSAIPSSNASASTIFTRLRRRISLSAAARRSLVVSRYTASCCRPNAHARDHDHDDDDVSIATPRARAAAASSRPSSVASSAARRSRAASPRTRSASVDAVYAANAPPTPHAKRPTRDATPIVMSRRIITLALSGGGSERVTQRVDRGFNQAQFGG